MRSTISGSLFSLYNIFLFFCGREPIGYSSFNLRNFNVKETKKAAMGPIYYILHYVGVLKQELKNLIRQFNQEVFWFCSQFCRSSAGSVCTACN